MKNFKTLMWIQVISVRYSLCHNLLMAKAKTLSLSYVSAHKHINAKVGHSKTVIFNFLKDPEDYRIEKLSIDPKKMSPALKLMISLL